MFNSKPCGQCGAVGRMINDVEGTSLGCREDMDKEVERKVTGAKERRKGRKGKKEGGSLCEEHANTSGRGLCSGVNRDENREPTAKRMWSARALFVMLRR